MSEEQWTIHIGMDMEPSTELGTHANTGDMAFMQQAIKKGINWETEKTLPLHAALVNSQDKIALLLLKAGSPITANNYYTAYRFGNTATFNKLKSPEYTKYIPDSNSKSIGTLLIDAARAADIETVTFALELKPNVNFMDYFYGFEDWTSLHHAAAHADDEMLQILIKAGAEVNAQNNKALTPLSLCAMRHKNVTRAMRKKCARTLIKQGAHSTRSISWIHMFLFTHFGSPVIPLES